MPRKKHSKPLGLAQRHTQDCTDLIAEAMQYDKPVPPAKSYKSPIVLPEEASFKQRREKPINNSTLPPLDWMSALDKYVPLKTQ